MQSNLRDRVRDRSGGQCEYCLMPDTPFPRHAFHVEHVCAIKHGGGGQLDNLAYSCAWCNLHKGPNLTGIDPQTGNIELLFHPRRDRWNAHFGIIAGVIEGLTPVGRATVRVLEMNAPMRVELRLKLAAKVPPQQPA